MAVILGLNAIHAKASASVPIDGKPVAAIAEKTLNRLKYFTRSPKRAVLKCLDPLPTLSAFGFSSTGSPYFAGLPCLPTGRPVSNSHRQTLPF